MRIDPVVSARGLLREFAEAGVLDFADVHVAQTVGRLHGETDDLVLLAMALTSRGVRQGSSCIELAEVAEQTRAEVLDPALDDEVDPAWVEQVNALPWPEPDAWASRLRSSGLVGDDASEINQHPLRLAEPEAGDIAGVGRVFLERHWAAESRSRAFLRRRRDTVPPPLDDALLTATAARLFDGAGLGADEPDLQASAAVTAARSWTSVIAGGPGTGKTTTVARLLALLNHVHTGHGQPRPLSVALAAPSGKAAARLHSSVHDEWSKPALREWARPQLSPGLTVHRLLGARGRHGGFRKGPDDPLSHDIVVIDEVSMLDLFMFERLLSALTPRTRLVLVGDPHQLSSVETGRVLADITQMHLPISTLDTAPAVVELQRNYRFSGAVQHLARAIVQGDADLAADLLSSPPDGSIALADVDVRQHTITTVPGLVDDLLSSGRRMVDAALEGDASAALLALDDHRLLCAHRQGAYGVTRFGREVADLLREHLGHPTGGELAVARPVLAGTNQPDIGVFNGDTGVMVNTPAGVRLALGQAAEPRLLSASLVDGLQPLHAMTVHKSQGSQFEVVTVVLPPLGSALLTRELLYTAVTRAKSRVRLIGTLEQVRAAVINPTRRRTGLGAALD